MEKSKPFKLAKGQSIPSAPITGSIDDIDKDFYELLAEQADNPTEKAKLVYAIINNVKLGDSSSIKILEKALLEGKYKKEDKFKITNDQFKRCILLAAERIKGDTGTTESTEND